MKIKYEIKYKSYFERMTTNLEMIGVQEAIIRETDTHPGLSRIWLSGITLSRRLKIENITEIYIKSENFSLENTQIELK